MKQKIFVVVATMMLVPMGLFGQTYQSLWKQVEEAQKKDLPQTAMSHLEKIEKKAEKELAYGQLLKSSLLYSSLQAEIAPDSLLPAVARLEKREKETKDVALKCVYDAILAKVYEQNHQLDMDNWLTKAQAYRKAALAHPEVLAQVQTPSYEPFVVKGKDSEIYENDLLSVVGQELSAWSWLNDYYVKSGNRRAACLTAMNMAYSIAQLDSLMAAYGDLPEACELAIKRLSMMGSEYTNAQRADFIQESLKRWGEWKRSNSLRNSWSAMTNPTFSVAAEWNVIEVNKPQTVELNSLRHLDQLSMRVYRTGLKGNTELNPNVDTDYKKIKQNLTEVTEAGRTLTFSGHEIYDYFNDSLQLQALTPGVYLLEFSSLPATKVVRSLYFVSGVRLLTQHMPNKKVRFVVVDATTGQPVSNASVTLSFNKYASNHFTKLLHCNSQGEVVFDNSANNRLYSAFAHTHSDEYCPESNAYGSYSYYERTYNVEHTNLFTDRSIYRPGQTVHVAAIVWKEQSAIDQVAVADKRVNMELRDSNHKLVGEKKVTTDRFGKCSTTFTLPTGLLNGRYTIRGNGSSTTIRVEEYKRPTFQVTFDEYKGTYQNGDIVHAKGKALSYAGVPVQGAKVKYTVRRQVAFWWMSYSWYWESGVIGNTTQKEVLKEAEAITDDNGTFEVEMPMQLPAGLGKSPMYYSFVVEADVTDVAGETHSGTMSLPLGSKPTALTCNMPQKVRSDQLPKVTFHRRNAAGNPIEGKVKYRLDDGKWKECDANVAVDVLNKPKSGEHRLEAVCQTDTIDMKFVVFGLDDKRPATTTSDWFYVSDYQFPNDGKPVTVQVGSSDPQVHIVYSAFAENELIECGSVDKNGELINRKFTYEEDYGNGLLLTFAWAKNGQRYQHTAYIERPRPSKQLRMSWETFRDRLKPGQEEEWRLKVLNPDGTPADASMMAVLYDKSLDQMAPHSWSFNPSSYVARPSTSWQWPSFSHLRVNASMAYKALNVPTLRFSAFDHDVYPYYHYMSSLRIRGATRMLGKGVASNEMMVMEAPMAAAAVVSEESADLEVLADKKVVGQEAKNEETKQEEAQVRENLNETAFCYPSLETDQDGVVTMKFTLPESLTTWHFMGVSHTMNMFRGYLSAEAVAQKDVMVQPNIPRFVRMGDEAQISARIFNISEKDVSGTAMLQLLNPEDNKVVCQKELPFSAEAGKTANVTFPMPSDEDLLSNYSLFVCKVVVTGDGFSDGEQHYLPILPNREFVTRTVPFTQHNPGVKSIDLAKLFPAGTTQQKLTVEYTNNPAWLMVQALPTVGQPSEHSAIDQAASYYSNLLAQYLMRQSPQAKATFEQWKREERQEPTLTSQLQKNEELKDLVLAETPWVWAADRESDQRQMLSEFFDENAINNRLSTAVEKLKKLQLSDGSFSWYPGMPGSMYITLSVEEMMARLSQMVGLKNDMQQMREKAFKYLGKEMVEMVKEMKKREKRGVKPTFPSFSALHWLYVCAIDHPEVPKDVASANDYLIKLLKKETRRQTIYEKALSAIIFAKCGDRQLAENNVKSLKEYTVFTEEMGRYYDTPRASYSWYDYKIPTEVAAIEAIQTVAPQDWQTVDEMRRWLLQEKRTQAWGTPINSVNAIFAFLESSKSESPLDAKGEPAVLAIDGKPMDLPKATAGLGYVKQAISQPQGTTFTATKTAEGTSWGAVYAQFLQKTSEVEASQSGISIKREVLVNGKPSVTTGLKVGDRIKIRITIESTRDLDFVQVVDRRAACMEPLKQLSGYQNGAYCSPKDYATHYFYYGISKGKHIIETEYYIDRAGCYETGTCTVGCAYAPEFRATAPSITFNISK